MLREVNLRGAPGGYRVRFGSCSPDEWTRLTLGFDDLVLYQTWPYGAVRWGERNLAHVVVTRDGDGRAAAAAQVRLARLPLPGLGVGVAYVPWAPLFRPGGSGPDLDACRLVLRALRSECAGRLGLCLCLRPQDGGGESREDGGVRGVLEAEGFALQPGADRYETVELDLSLAPEEIRKGAARAWRQQLARGERNGLDVAEGTDPSFYDAFLWIYAEMKERKQFTTFVDAREFRAVQERLPEALRMRILLCRQAGEPVAALVYSALGKRAVGILAATGPRGREMRAGHVLWWRAVELLHERGFRRLDMGGIDAARAPGPAQFKLGLAGKTGAVVRHIGQFEAPGGWLSRLCLGAGSALVAAYRRIRRARPDAGRGADAPGAAPGEKEEVASDRS